MAVVIDQNGIVTCNARNGIMMCNARVCDVWCYADLRCGNCSLWNAFHKIIEINADEV